MRNAEIREEMKIKKIPQWKLGELLGVSENTVNRWLRTELPADKKKQMLQVIEDYDAEKE